jgi:hypothetical protein
MKITRDTLANRIMPLVLLLVALSVFLFALITNALGTFAPEEDSAAPTSTNTPTSYHQLYENV